MKSTVVYATIAFALLCTCARAGLPKWNSLITGPAPPSPDPTFIVLPSLAVPTPELMASPDANLVLPSAAPVPVSALELEESPSVSIAPLSATVSATPSVSVSTPGRLFPIISIDPVSVVNLLPTKATPEVEEIPFITPESSTEPESTTEPKEVKKKGACFPSHARVTLKDGSIIPISEVQVGDLVESEPGKFSPVLMHTHADAKAFSPFVVLGTKRGAVIGASPGHYLLTTDGKLQIANDFRLHDELLTAHGVDRIVSVNLVMYRGLYNPQTASGKLMVRLGEMGAVQASTYTTAVFPEAAHAALTLLRVMQNLFGITFPTLSTLVPDTNLSSYVCSKSSRFRPLIYHLHTGLRLLVAFFVASTN